MSDDGYRYVGTDRDGFDLYDGDYGFRWGAVEVTRLASVEGRGVLLSVSCDAGEVIVTVTPAGQSMHVECRQTHPVKPTVMQTLHRWRARGRGRGRRGWIDAWAREVTPPSEDHRNPEQEHPR